MTSHNKSVFRPALLCVVHINLLVFPIPDAAASQQHLLSASALSLGQFGKYFFFQYLKYKITRSPTADTSFLGRLCKTRPGSCFVDEQCKDLFVQLLQRISACKDLKLLTAGSSFGMKPHSCFKKKKNNQQKPRNVFL